MPRVLMPYRCGFESGIWAWPEQDGLAEITMEVNGRLIASTVVSAAEVNTPEGFARLQAWWQAEINRRC